MHECFEYRPETGELIWRERPLVHFNSTWAQNRSNSQYAGTIAGCTAPAKRTHYANVKVCDSTYKVHRIIYFMQNPEADQNFQVDHIDHNGLNNRLDNLRLVTCSANQRNARTQKNNRTGVVGVHWHAASGKWAASICARGRTINFPVTADFFEAVCTRKNAEIKYGFHTNHGKA